MRFCPKCGAGIFNSNLSACPMCNADINAEASAESYFSKPALSTLWAKIFCVLLVLDALWVAIDGIMVINLETAFYMRKYGYLGSYIESMENFLGFGGAIEAIAAIVAVYGLLTYKKIGPRFTYATHFLFITTNMMYFINWADECKVYSMNIDGTGEKKLSDISTEVLYAYGPYIYVNDRNSMRELYRISLEDGSSYMLTMDDTYFITGYDSTIYFRNGSDALNVYRMTATGEVYAPINTARSGYLNADKGYLYFTNFEEESLYKVREDGTELTKLCDGDPSYTSVNGDYLYFFSDSDGKKLYRIRKDGTGKECLN